MTIVVVKESIAASAEAVWEILGNFGGIKVGGPITAFHMEGEGVGAVRTITMGGGQVIERLETFDPEQLTFSYVITNQDCPLPVANYSSVVQITRDGANGCTVEWTGTFEPRGVPEAQAIEIVTGIYAGGIKGASQALAG